jgi:hypothetical protein
MIGLTVKSVDCYFAPVRRNMRLNKTEAFHFPLGFLTTAAGACKNNLQCRR